MNDPKYIGGVFLAALMCLGFPSATFAQSASDQLDNATNGEQTTGQIFDGGRTPTDAVPDRGADVAPVPNPQPVDNSGSEDAGSGATQDSRSDATPSTDSDTAPDRSADVPSAPDPQPDENSGSQDSSSNATPSADADTAPDRGADAASEPDQQPTENSAPQDSDSSATPRADAAQ
jgi:hypothetical protein